MKLKAALFDMDGTILDSRPIRDAIIASFVGEENIEAYRLARKVAPGSGVEQICYVLINNFGIEETPEQLAKLYVARVKELFSKEEITLISGFEEFITHLQEQGIQAALATNAQDFVLDIIKQRMPLAKYFGKHIYNSSMVNSYKPHPGIYLHALNNLGMEPIDCLVFEDSSHGIAAAQAAGMRCIGVNSHGNYEELSRADSIIIDYRGLTIEQLNSQ